MKPLDRARLKLRRANYHVNLLLDVVEEFNKLDLCRVAVEQNDERQAILRVYDVRPTPPEWGVLIGDCAHNLRSALDHIAYGLARPHFYPDPVPTTVQFPIFRWRWWYRGERGRRGAASQMRGFPRGARTAVEQLQPYHHWKWPETWLLWQLAEISNVDKHRLLHVTNVSAIGTRLSFEPVGASVIEQEVIPGPIKDGAILARLKFGPRNPRYVKVNAEIAALEMFDEGSPESIQGHRVTGTLGAISNFIRDEVIPRFERFFP